MKKLSALLLVFILCFSLGCTKENQEDLSSTGITQEVEQTKDITPESTPSNENASDDFKPDDIQPEDAPIGSPLLYKATDADGSVIWVLGSIHIGREDFYPLPDYIMNPLKNADALAVEVDIFKFEKDISAQTKALMQLVYADGTTIKDHIDADTYNSASEILSSLGLSAVLDYYSPILWASLIENIIYDKLNYDAALGVDRHLLTFAAENNIKVYEIESGESQYATLASFSPELQLLRLQSVIEQYSNMDESKSEIDLLIDAWALGDKNTFVGDYELPDDMPAEEKSLYEEYIDKMLTKRNIIMTDFAENALKNNEEIFICVGAAHVVGENSITDLLTEKGYKVEVITNA